jgi:muramoyltetrapeptide carboxypeptidase LdcA involved in peptidoglycan recycling
MINKYSKLQKGDTVGIITPSAAGNVVLKQKFQQGIEAIKNLGLNIELGFLTSQMFAKDGYRLGSALERAEEFNQLYKNDKVRGIICSIGGSNSASILPYIDYEYIKSNPKLVCGYSDITAIHCALLSKGNLSSLYGCAVIPSFGEYPYPMKYTIDNFKLQTGLNETNFPKKFNSPKQYTNQFIDATKKGWKNVKRKYAANEGWKVVKEGEAKGELLIMNQNTLLSLAGTEYFPDFTNKILILEQMESSIPLEERQLNHLKLLGVFEKLSGLIFSKFEKLSIGNSKLLHQDLINEFVNCKPNTPIVYNFDCGHTFPMLSLPQMIKVNLIAKKNTVSFIQLESAYK